MASRATTMTKWLDMSVSVSIWAKPMMNDATIVPPQLPRPPMMQTATAKMSTLYPCSTTMLPRGKSKTAAKAARPGAYCERNDGRHVGVDAQHHSRPLVLGDAPQGKPDLAVPGEQEEEDEGTDARHNDKEPLVIYGHAQISCVEPGMKTGSVYVMPRRPPHRRPSMMASPTAYVPIISEISMPLILMMMNR